MAQRRAHPPGWRDRAVGGARRHRRWLRAERRGHPAAAGDEARRCWRAVRALRIFGSTVLCLVRVACGRCSALLLRRAQARLPEAVGLVRGPRHLRRRRRHLPAPRWSAVRRTPATAVTFTQRGAGARARRRGAHGVRAARPRRARRPLARGGADGGELNFPSRRYERLILPQALRELIHRHSCAVGDKGAKSAGQMPRYRPRARRSPRWRTIAVWIAPCTARPRRPAPCSSTSSGHAIAHASVAQTPPFAAEQRPAISCGAARSL